MNFEIIGKIQEAETFATGSGIRELSRLRRLYGESKWRKRRGIATVKFGSGALRKVELHWYEATGIGQKEHKIKRFLD